MKGIHIKVISINIFLNYMQVIRIIILNRTKLFQNINSESFNALHI
jgi:hypothetical protein